MTAQVFPAMNQHPLAPFPGAFSISSFSSLTFYRIHTLDFLEFLSTTIGRMASSQIDLPPASHMQCSGHPIDDNEPKVSQPEHHEDLSLPETGRDDIRLQRLGKNPVLKASGNLIL